MTVPVVENMKSAFQDANSISAEALARIYHDDVVFIDPVHKLEGLNTLSGYLSKVYKNVTSCRFQYTDEMLLDGRGSVRWRMHLQHPKLNGGEEIVVKGATFIEYDDRITYQEDYYDLGAMLYEHITLLGTTVRYVKNRLS
ncbi:MAG: nuclear transport factor 2 family protein [Pseudomonadota bacterium]